MGTILLWRAAAVLANSRVSKRGGGGGGGGRGKLQRSAPAPPKINRAPFHFSTFSWSRVSTPVSQRAPSSERDMFLVYSHEDAYSLMAEPSNFIRQKTWTVLRGVSSLSRPSSVRVVVRTSNQAYSGPAPFLFSQSRAEVNERRREGEREVPNPNVISTV